MVSHEFSIYLNATVISTQIIFGAWRVFRLWDEHAAKLMTVIYARIRTLWSDGLYTMDVNIHRPIDWQWLMNSSTTLDSLCSKSKQWVPVTANKAGKRRTKKRRAIAPTYVIQKNRPVWRAPSNLDFFRQWRAKRVSAGDSYYNMIHTGNGNAAAAEPPKPETVEILR